MSIDCWEEYLEKLVDKRLDDYHDLLNSGLKEVPNRYEILLEVAAEELHRLQYEDDDI